MKATLDKLDGLVRKLNIEVPATQVQSAFEKVYRGIQKNANVKGFRKGKAPLATIRSIYAERVRQDVLNDLISDSYGQALSDHKLEPVGYPQINIQEFIENGAFIYSAQFEVRPEVHIKKSEGLEIEKEILQIGDEQIQSVLENIQKGQAQTVPLLEDRSLVKGDLAVLDFEGFIDGQPLENSKAEGRTLEVGHAQFIDGFEDGLVGMKAGEERTLNLKFPDEYHAKEIAGKPVTFKVKLQSISKRELPEINDELAKKVGSFQNLQELKDAIKKDITEGEERRIRDELRNSVLKALVDANPVEAPPSLVAQQKEMIVADVKEKLSQQGLGEAEFQDYVTKWDADFTSSATFMVQSTFLVDALAIKLNLRAQPADIEGKIDEFAKQTGIDRARVAEFYNENDRRSRLAFQITEERVVNYLIEKAKIKEVPKKSNS